jgi:hypothetical protein
MENCIDSKSKCRCKNLNWCVKPEYCKVRIPWAARETSDGLSHKRIVASLRSKLRLRNSQRRYI